MSLSKTPIKLSKNTMELTNSTSKFINNAQAKNSTSQRKKPSNRKFQEEWSYLIYLLICQKTASRSSLQTWLKSQKLISPECPTAKIKALLLFILKMLLRFLRRLKLLTNWKSTDKCYERLTSWLMCNKKFSTPKQTPARKIMQCTKRDCSETC